MEGNRNPGTPHLGQNSAAWRTSIQQEAERTTSLVLTHKERVELQHPTKMFRLY